MRHARGQGVWIHGNQEVVRHRPDERYTYIKLILNYFNSIKYFCSFKYQWLLATFRRPWLFLDIYGYIYTFMAQH